ncbi:PIN domain nuclease [Winogradskya humida]|uniref:Ribonuclease VapC n=1 Tax=Winogradskya humida TaxID=113566 RepID=A0ABQ4A0H0_9ACTN|nr:PIN domain nuclease [Actinoplanes humidus]GIE24341.1 hypothetical protein Ahu01nite_074430 [Actinoplanes humidus]
MSARKFLGDTSAFTRLSNNEEVRTAWKERLSQGLISVCPVTELEILFSARSQEHRHMMEARLENLYPWVTMPDQVYKRAKEVQASLTKHGKHRSAGPVDLLVAAAAELQDLTLLHYDRDFVTIAEVTGQPVRWVAEPGSID